MDFGSIKPQGVLGPKNNERVSDKKDKAKTSSGKTSAAGGDTHPPTSSQPEKASKVQASLLHLLMGLVLVRCGNNGLSPLYPA